MIVSAGEIEGFDQLTARYAGRVRDHCQYTVAPEDGPRRISHKGAVHTTGVCHEHLLVARQAPGQKPGLGDEILRKAGYEEGIIS